MAFRKIEAGLVHADVDDFIGKTGTIFYDNSLGDFRISDGSTPGGIALSFGGGEGGTYTLPTATTTVKGGVKIDGSTIVIANQVISVGTVPYSSISGKPTIPTNNNELTNGAGYITSSSLTGLATETYVTTRGYITSAALSTYALSSSIPTDISQLTDTTNLLGTGGGGGGTTYITNTVENPYSFSIAGDDSTLREISTGESIKFTGAGGIAITTDAEGNVTVTGTPVSLVGYATETYVTTQGYITSSALTGYALTTAIPTNNNQLTNGAGYITSSALTGLATETYVTTRGYITSSALTGLATETFVTTQGYITSSALTGLATENYVTSRGYITGLSWNQLTDKPNLAGTYSFNVAADDSTLREISSEETVKFIGAGGITTSSDAEGAITITGPSLAGLATETYVTTQGYITSSALTGLATETYVNQAVTNLVDGAPAMLDTLKELALSLNNDSNLAATLVTEINKKANIADLVLTIAGDDSTEKTISLGEGIRLQGTGSITITTDLEGKVTINGAAPDLSAYALTSAVPTNNNQLSNGAGYITTAVNANGTLSLPILPAEPANLQAGQIALANGTSWDPLNKGEGRLYTALYTGAGWIEIGGLTENKAYGMILGG